MIELYAEFTRSGATYTPFPDSRNHRIPLEALAEERTRAQLAALWTDPESLNPTRASARVTREVAGLLATLARSLEADGHRADHVAAFLTRCLFSMFAEDVELLPKGADGLGGFFGLLQRHRDDPATLTEMLRVLWFDMDRGGFSPVLANRLLRFNGKLFKNASTDGYVLPLTPQQVGLLLEAAGCNWREVEPAIFGTLLERALDPAERHALGAHYTPRAYVERLVLPTVMEPLRADWADAQAAALVLASAGDFAGARTQVRRFHHYLCTVRVLDPACGSGNFLYVTLEHLKRLEGEVLDQLATFGQDTDAGRQDILALEGETVTLQQLRGIEINERAAALAELVLWIGYLQWHIRTRGNQAVAEPVIHDYGNIECRDAVLDWDDLEPAYSAPDPETGERQLLSRWDGTTFRLHPVTGERVPDESAQVPQWRYVRARRAPWPEAGFVVGNPPFIGNKRMRETLGDGYAEALRAAWDDVPESADFVMYWWAHAAGLALQGRIRRFGFITTNSLTMIFNRRVVQAACDRGLSLVFAVPDHPWVDSTNGAAVRIAMTAAVAQRADSAVAGIGRLLRVTAEAAGEHGEQMVAVAEQHGIINPDLTVGVRLDDAGPLLACSGLAFRGMTLLGSGFWVEPDDVLVETDRAALKALRNGRDLTDSPRGVYAIDLFDMDLETVRHRHPAAYQRVLHNVKPERDLSQRASYREKWWTFAEPRPELRKAVAALPRYVVTPMTAKHRTFQFLERDVLPDQGLIAIAVSGAFELGVLSSRVHVQWAFAAGGTLEDRPRYNNVRCFDPFPFPSEDTGLTADLQTRIGELAEQIDTHRKRVQAENAGVITLTGVYNVMDALRQGRALTARERMIHDIGLVSVLRELHTDLDTAVLAAYGWGDLGDGLAQGPHTCLLAGEAPPAFESARAELLQRIVALNARRAAEEADGRVRWLRPEFQDEASCSGPASARGEPTPARQSELLPEPEIVVSAQESTPMPWPATLPEQVRAVAKVLETGKRAFHITAIETRFKGRGPWKRSLPRILDTLEALGRARREGDAWRA